MVKKTTENVVDGGKNKKGQFVRGHKKLGGRQKGTKNHDGLGAVLQMLKDLVSEKKNINRIKSSMQEAINKRPLHFYHTYIMPLLPKSIAIDPGEGNDMTIILSNKGRSTKKQTSRESQ